MPSQKDKKVKRRNPDLSMGIGLIIFGAVFAAIMAFMIVGGIKFKESAMTCEAAVSRIETEMNLNMDIDDDRHDRTIYVKYVVNGREYESNLRHDFGGMYVGQVLYIYYDPNDPSEIRPVGFIGTYYFMVGMGVLCAVIGVVTVVYWRRKQLQWRLLLRRGDKVTAEFERVDINTSLEVNHKNPYIIYCNWTDRYGVQHTLKSEHLWFDPSPIIEEKQIKSFPVYMDLLNPKRYYMSVEELESDPSDG